MTRNDRFPFRQRQWGDLWAASMVLLHTMAWQRQRDTRGLRATSPRWWGHLFALVCIWTMGWLASSVVLEGGTGRLPSPYRSDTATPPGLSTTTSGSRWLGWIGSGAAVFSRVGERVAVRVGAGFRRPTTALRCLLRRGRQRWPGPGWPPAKWTSTCSAAVSRTRSRPVAAASPVTTGVLARSFKHAGGRGVPGGHPGARPVDRTSDRSAGNARSLTSVDGAEDAPDCPTLPGLR